MKVRLSFDDPAKVMGDVESDMAYAASTTMDRVTDGMLHDIKGQILASGLGQRLANSWRGTRYPKNENSLRSAAYVWSPEAVIMNAFNRGANIKPLGGKSFLAIPTENVPERRGVKLSPREVEQRFGRRLRFAKASGGRVVAYFDVSGLPRRLRASASSTKRRRGVVMFILTPRVRLAKRLDFDSIKERWAAKIESLLMETAA